MNFTLKFHTSAPTNLEYYEIRARIQFELKDKKYVAAHVTDRSVSFKDTRWFMRRNFEFMLDGGEFVISDEPNNRKLLTLNYYWRYYPPLLIYSFLVIVSILNKMYDGIWFFGGFCAIVMPIDIMRARGKANELLRNILKADS
ncbi:MAG TPA: hypothetical protein VHC47_01905 [Mucilaginibacter sp.]|nr:hypothetical protein [Mucilaginibacter sp.]